MIASYFSLAFRSNLFHFAGEGKFHSKWRIFE
jgi:hypothetical protein